MINYCFGVRTATGTVTYDIKWLNIAKQFCCDIFCLLRIL